MQTNLSLLLILIAIINLYDCKESYQKVLKSCGKSQSFLYKENGKSHRMVEMAFLNNTITDCFIYGDKKLVLHKISKMFCRPKVLFVNKKTLSQLALKCSEWLLNQLESGHLAHYSDNDFPDEYNNKIDRNFFEGCLIYPGTNWCGVGDIAEDYDDLGKEIETDKCCRRHDYCEDIILSKKTKYNLTNDAIHTKSKCSCDEEFKKCLSNVENKTSKTIAKLYFNLIQIQCFKNDYPIIECLEYRGIPFFWRSCQKYSLDASKPTLYQFFDAIFVD